jgi:hypothetical protein
LARGFHVIYPPSIRGLTDDIAAASFALARDIRTSFRTGTGMPYATYIGHAGLDRRSAWGAETRTSRCGGDFVFVDEAAEQVTSHHAQILRIRLGVDQ